MTTIRPTTPGLVQPQTSPADAARLAAQKAFFDAALGRAPAPTAPSAAAQVQAAPVNRQPTTSQIQAAQAEPTRLLRPGSLLDIRV